MLHVCVRAQWLLAIAGMHGADHTAPDHHCDKSVAAAQHATRQLHVFMWLLFFGHCVSYVEPPLATHGYYGVQQAS